MKPLLSVIIPTHAPNPGWFERALSGLREQKLAADVWELVVVDNASPDPQMFWSTEFMSQATNIIINRRAAYETPSLENLFIVNLLRKKMKKWFVYTLQQYA